MAPPWPWEDQRGGLPAAYWEPQVDGAGWSCPGAELILSPTVQEWM